MIKVCSKCKHEKSLKDFHVQNKKENTFHTQCKQCVSEYGKKRTNSDVHQIRLWLIRKDKEVKKTYPIFKKCAKCKTEKPMKDFNSRGVSSIRKDGTDIKSARCKECLKIDIKEWREKNLKREREKARLRMSKYIKENYYEHKEKRRAWKAKGREEINDWYVKTLLLREGSNGASLLKRKQIPQSLIDLKREEIKLNREIKKRKNDKSI